VPILSDLERKAYHAAHRILTERPYISRLAAPGGQRSAAVVAMQAHGVKELKTYRNTLRRQGNGGLQALEIAQLGAVPMEYRTVKSYSRCRNTETDGFGCIAQPADGAIAPAEEGEGYVQSWDRVIMQRGSL